MTESFKGTAGQPVELTLKHFAENAPTGIIQSTATDVPLKLVPLHEAAVNKPTKGSSVYGGCGTEPI